MGSKGEKIYGDYAREATGVLLVGGWILWAKTGIFTKANLDLNEDREEISLIRKRKKSLTRIALVFVLKETQEMCSGPHPKRLFCE